MPVALFKSSFGHPSIDTETGVLSGVKVMELGKDASFQSEDGSAKKVTITPDHISALMAHAGNRAIPSHWTHDYFGKSEDPMHAKVGSLKNFRKDDAGDLIADLHLSPGEHRSTALWNAANDPDGMMISAVFDYAKSDPKCMPLNFRAADLVSQGAATTALFRKATAYFSNEPENKPMIDIQELIAALSDPTSGPHLGAAIKAAIKSAGKGDDDTAEMSDDDTAAMESTADVKPEDKKPEDDQKPALMRRLMPILRAINRRTTALATTETAILEKAKVQAKAEIETAKLGRGKFPNISSAETEPKTATAKFNALITELTSKGVKSGVATQTVLAEHKEIHTAMLKEQGVLR